MQGFDVDVEVVNPFLEAIINVFSQMFGIKLRRGKLSLKENPYPNYETAIVVRATGDYKGVVVYSMKYDTGWKLIYQLFPEKPPAEAKKEFADIIGEIANMITGNAATLLVSKNREIILSPPIVIEDITRSKHPVFNVKIPTIAINFYSPYGVLEANVALIKK
jgi:chemotaxis protein CheX